MDRFTLHVPLARNDGPPVTDAEFSAIENDLLSFASGFTATEGVGGWRGDGRIYREPVRLYAVDVAPHIATAVADRLLSLAAFVAAALEQEVVYITRTSIETALVNPSNVIDTSLINEAPPS